MSGTVRVLVVDDSALMRKLIPQILERDSSIQVIGTAMDGTFVERKIEELKPHVVTLDLEMPRMNGMETLRAITRKHRLPVIVVSSHTTEGASATFRALSMGAFDFVPKPRDIAPAHMQEIAAELITKIKLAAETGMPKAAAMVFAPQASTKAPKIAGGRPAKIVAIGVSTGGPNALQFLFSQLPATFPGAIVVVQHMPKGFTEMFARRLDDCSALEVKEARSGDLLVAGRVLICPSNRHIKVRRLPLGDVVTLTDDPRISGHRPSADVLLHSAAREFGHQTIGVLMTGMGEDGAEGLGAIKAAGGLTIAQDEESCVVYGMPKAAVERGYAMRVVPLEALASTLQVHCTVEPRGEAPVAVPAASLEI